MKKRIAYLGLMLAFALILSYVESLIPFFSGIPGVKLGLANLVTLLCLYFFPVKYAFLIATARVLTAGFLFGSMFSILYSLAGAYFSFFVMLFAKKVLKFGILGVSILGGIFHNVGQLLVAVLIVENYRIAYLLPYLLLSGILTGAAIGLAGNSLILYLKKIIH